MAITDNKGQELHSGTTHAKLEGWKEIAVYVKRGIRTVQRWEARGFPVRRHPASGAVYALISEIDAWVNSVKDRPANSDQERERLPVSNGSSEVQVPVIEAIAPVLGVGVQPWVLFLIASVLAGVLAAAIAKPAYGLAIFFFWVGAILLMLGYVRMADTLVARAIVAVYLTAAMSYTASASTLPDVLDRVINLTTLPPSIPYSFAIGLKFIPLFILVFIYWVLGAHGGGTASWSNVWLDRAYMLTGALFLLATVVCLSVISADLRIWKAGLVGGWILCVTYTVIFSANLAVWIFARRVFKSKPLASSRRIPLFCTIAYLPVALAAFFMDSEYNRVNTYYLDVRWPEAYVAANPDAVKEFDLREHLGTKVGQDLRHLLIDSDFSQALRNGTFYKQHFDEPFQLGSRAVIFAFRPGTRSDRGRRPFVSIRFPKELADALRFESIGGE
jgi:hypothetical protein